MSDQSDIDLDDMLVVDNQPFPHRFDKVPYQFSSHGSYGGKSDFIVKNLEEKYSKKKQ